MLAGLFALTGCGVAVEDTPEIPDAVAEVTEEPENTISPAGPTEDFYRYINEETLRNMEFGYGDMSVGSFNEDLAGDQVKDIIRTVAAGSGYAPGSEEAIIKTAYDLYLDYDFDNAPVPAELDALLYEIDGISSMEEFFRVDAKLDRDYGVTNILYLQVGSDYRNGGANALAFGQYSGVLDVAFEDLEESYTPLNSLKRAGSVMRKALGHEKAEADALGKDLGLLAMDLYTATDMVVVMHDMFYEFQETVTKQEADEILSNVDLDTYLTDLGYDLKDCGKLTFVDRGQLAGLNALLTEEHLEALKTWKLCQFGTSYRRFIAGRYPGLDEYLQIDYRDPEEQAADEVMTGFYEETDPLYVEQYYNAAMDERLIAMCDEIREGYRGLIKNADWLSSKTREGLLTKLENIVYVTGMDLQRHDNAAYKDLTGSDYFAYQLHYKRLKNAMARASLAEAPDRKVPTMPMQMVNACYNPAFNHINITVAIMIPPFFSMEADEYTNLGGLGMVIAHEMGHAFDSNCIKFDANGIYDPSWIPEEDRAVLEERNRKAVKYFEDFFTVFGVYHVDGEQTLGENYADLGGMECVSSLARTKEQRERLFENYARIWCEKRVDEALLDQLNTDEHSPSVIRTNAILSTLDAFYETYDVKEGDGMYIAPENRISRWK